MTVEQWLGKDNILGIDIWHKKYQYQDETFEEWINRISDGNSEIKELILQKKFLFGGRILSNRGLEKLGKKISLSNCYVMSPPDDNIESIFDCAKKLARTYSYGGGCGIDIGKLRPNGCKVNNAADKTTGAVSFMDLYSMVTGLIGQSGRRGALMISIPCTHPDLLEFIDVKTDLNRVTKANISIRITNEFMKAVKDKRQFLLYFDIESTGEHIEKKVNAYEVFHKLCENNWNYAEPGMLFWDTITGYNLLSNNKDFEYAGTNPCVTGDTLILTNKGYFQIRDIVDKPTTIWNGYEWSDVYVRITGTNQKMLKITLSDGSELDCTRYHKFILSDNSRVEANNLNIGDKLIKCIFPIIEGENNSLEKIAYTQGFFMGDGSSESNRKRLSIKLIGEKRKVIDRLIYSNNNYCPSFDGDFLTLEYNKQAFNKEFVPDAKYNIRTRLNWLAGYIDSDGTLQSKDGSISISSINKSILLKVKYLLNTIGCNGTISMMYPEQIKEMPKNDGTENTIECLCQTSYRLLISCYNIKRLVDLGLSLTRVPMIANPDRDASRYIYVKDIKEIEDCETVYCFNEPKNHSGIFNGVITAQCAEEPLPAGGSCLLGSINLSAFVKNDSFDFGDFSNTVSTAVIALNEVLDEGLLLHPLQEQRDTVRDWRQIGLGIMGLADMLIKLKLTYGSKESIELCDNIGKCLTNKAIIQSAYLAKVNKTTYPKYNPLIVETEFFNTNITNTDDRELVKKYGLMNSQLLTIAPTGTLSTMLGISGGIEPIYANFYTRKTESLHGHDEYYKVYTPIVERYMQDNKIKDDKDLPKFFITSQELDFYDRIKMQEVWQKHIDASISSTINLSHDATVEEVEKLYIYAWQHNLKGVTVYRDGCKRSGILTTTEIKSDTSSTSIQKSEPIPRGMIIKADDNCIGRKRTLQTGCGSLHVEAFFDPTTGELLETYFSKGSSGGCGNFMVGLSRMISLSARGGVDIYSIVDQLNSSGSCPSYAVRSATKHDTSKGSCCPVAIGNVLLEMYEEVHNDIFEEDEENEEEHLIITTSLKITPKQLDKNNCPQCGESLIFEGGCIICKNCGWSKCE